MCKFISSQFFVSYLNVNKTERNELFMKRKIVITMIVCIIGALIGVIAYKSTTSVKVDAIDISSLSTEELASYWDGVVRCSDDEPYKDIAPMISKTDYINTYQKEPSDDEFVYYDSEEDMYYYSNPAYTEDIKRAQEEFWNQIAFQDAAKSLESTVETTNGTIIADEETNTMTFYSDGGSNSNETNETSNEN